MKCADGINFVVLFLLLIAIAILTGLAYLLTRSDEKLQKAREEIVRLVALSEDLHKTEFEHSQLLKQQRDEARRQRDILAARQAVEVDAVKPATRRNSKGQFVKKVESDG